MKITKVKPYIVKTINSVDEFNTVQDELYDAGYNFLGDKVNCDIVMRFVREFPIYISNLPFSDDIKNVQLSRRTRFNQFDNSIIWLDDKMFDTLKLRAEKLQIIEKL